MPTRSKFIGGVLDGQEYEVSEGVEVLRVPTQDGLRKTYLDEVILEWEVYVKKGDVYEYVETKTHI